MFVPVKADFPLPRLPALTLIVSVLCFAIFIKQLADRDNFNRAIDRYCMQDRSRLQEMVFSRIEEQNHYGCAELMYRINEAENTEQFIEELVLKMRPLVGFSYDDSRHYVKGMLEDELRHYRSMVPRQDHEGLAYYTKSWNPLTMISSSFAHGDWLHIIFNLVFFIAFAATVEVLIGPAMFTVSIIAMALFIGVFCSVGAYATGAHYWTVGLSGIVTGMMGLHTYLLPQGRIRCYYFFIVIFGSVAVPAWALTLWYVGGDIYRLFAFEDNGVVNVMAHVTGGFAGYLFGVAFLGKAKKRALSSNIELAV